MKIISWVVLILILLTDVALADKRLDGVPEPRLLSPVTEKVDLSGKSSLEFKWSPFEGTLFSRTGYDFRLYKGRNMIAAAQIVKKKVDPKVYSIVLNADLFEDGQVYTWALRQVYYDDKSDAAHQAFKVIKNK